MTINKLLTLFLASGIILPMAASATDLPWLNFRLADDSEVTVASDNLKITYSDGELHLQSSTIDRILKVADLRSMYFSETSAAETISADPESALTFYTTDGVEVGHFPDFEAAKKSLPSGLYIARGASKTIKVIF